jgi:hypothetical protein
MTHTERLTERPITFALAEADEDLAVARLAFLAQDHHAALDAAIDACLARTERSLYTRWRAISFLARVRYEDQPTPGPAGHVQRRPLQRRQEADPGEPRGYEARRPAKLEVVLRAGGVRRRLRSAVDDLQNHRTGWHVDGPLHGGVVKQHGSV